jgi:hypothetical protein
MEAETNLIARKTFTINGDRYIAERRSDAAWELYEVMFGWSTSEVQGQAEQRSWRIQLREPDRSAVMRAFDLVD